MKFGVRQYFPFASLFFANGCTDLTEEERISIIAAPEFLDFVEQSSKIVQRALNDNYDYIRDYTSGAEAGGYVPPRTAS